MHIPEDGYLLRIFVGESDRHGHHPLYEAIVLKARETGLAGATVVRGVMGFGKHSVLHTAKILRLSEDLPMVVEIADSLEKIEQFLPVLDQMITDGMMTLERVRVIEYKPEKPSPSSSHPARSLRAPNRTHLRLSCRRRIHKCRSRSPPVAMHSSGNLIRYVRENPSLPDFE